MVFVNEIEAEQGPGFRVAVSLERAGNPDRAVTRMKAVLATRGIDA